jgi:hypothetical protein
MTFGKCIWDGCTRHAVKETTSACRDHHAALRDHRCEKCQGPLASRSEQDRGRCRRCAAVRAA